MVDASVYFGYHWWFGIRRLHYDQKQWLGEDFMFKRLLLDWPRVVCSMSSKP
jgi:hypothetical protein